MKTKKQLVTERLEPRMCLAATFPIKHIIHETGNGTQSVLFADVDADADLDIVTSSYADKEFGWFERGENGYIRKSLPTDNFSSAYPIAAGLINADSQMDIVVGDYEGDRLLWYPSSPFGFGKPIEISREVEHIQHIEIVDVNGDQSLDVVAAFEEYIKWYEYSPDLGTFSSGVTLFDELNNYDVDEFEFADVDDNSTIDLILAIDDPCCDTSPSPARIRFGNESGGFSDEVVLFETRNRISSIATGDYNQDGKTDIVLGFRSGVIRYYQQADNGFETGLNLTDQPNYPVQIESADVDSDGDLDLVVAARDANLIALIENTHGQSKPFRYSAVANIASPRSISLGDADGDGDLDIAVGNNVQGGSQVVILENRAIGDVNNDGVFNSSDFVAVFIAGEYEDDVAGNSTFETGDWNGDGDFDSSDFVAAFQAGTYVATASPESVFAHDPIFNNKSRRVGAIHDRLMEQDNHWFLD
ncbi:MAG: VCBS repeat-containing protein [Planctomycetales bacterium]|nr:VCBS repeat-containing protein [Planctomycetales bacterium]